MANNKSHINYIGQLDRVGFPSSVNKFIKGSVGEKAISTEDPLYLTFFLDFDPSTADTQHLGGLKFNSLLEHMQDWENDDMPAVDLGQTPSVLEVSTKEYLQRMDSMKLGSATNTPASNLVEFHKILHDTYLHAPWFFQSVSGISELWKKATNVTEGSKKATLTISCLESVDMRILQMADRYRKAVYDTDALAYRVPENLRNFSFDLYLFEIRNLKQYAKKRVPNSVSPVMEVSPFTDGAHYIKFKCKMCEFDFSETLAGGASPVDFKAYTDEKPFTPSFKIIVNWVQEETAYQPVQRIAQDNLSTRSEVTGSNFDNQGLGIFQGAADGLTSEINRQIRNVASIPARVIGAITNEIQTTVTGAVLGNTYDKRNLGDISGLTDKIGQVYTPPSRTSPVGPPAPTDLGKAGGY